MNKTTEKQRTTLLDEADRDNSMYQVSTLQALALGYLRRVVSVSELLSHGDTGLGTFEDLNGEMIALDGRCYRAASDGSAQEMRPDEGVPFAVVSRLKGSISWECSEIKGFGKLTDILNNKVDEHFGLNSMHILRIDGVFDLVDARSETPSRKSQHVELKELLDKTQYAFQFENIKGTLIGLYFPDYMDGINLPGWHMHFISEDRTKGGHVFDIRIRECRIRMDKVSRIEMQLPTEVQFDTYDLKKVSQKDVKSVEEGQG